MTLIAWLFGACPLAAQLKPGPVPFISCAKGACAVNLPNAVQVVISGEFPGFAPYAQTCFPDYYSGTYPFSAREAMFAVAADFNGDGRQDVALLGRWGEEEVFIGVVSLGRGYKAYLIKSHPRTQECGSLDTYLAYAHPGSHTEFTDEPKGRKFTIQNPGVSIIYDEHASDLYYFKAGGFHFYTTGD